MRILFDNVLDVATLTSLNAEDAYPVRNLISPFLRQIYQASGATDTITIALTEDVDIDAIFWGFTNIRQMNVSMYDASDALLELIYIEHERVGYYYGYSDIYLYGYDPDKYYGYFSRDSEAYFDPSSWILPSVISGVRKIVIELATDEAKLYMGGMGIGLAYKMPNPDEQFTEGWIDNSVVSRSQAGQTVRDYVVPLRTYGFRFSTPDRETMNELRSIYKNCGIGAKLWLDGTERNHEFIPPLYGVLDEWTENEKSGKQYKFGLTITEAR